ncbi:neuropeptide receptor 15-like [Tubulanus polymorphus]|uniref:neuropeptide receptor 15-like n=1 Tax=Tubulanus polymorphus TaxID=672921 RepID=UPI003DA58B93
MAHNSTAATEYTNLNNSADHCKNSSCHSIKNSPLAMAEMIGIAVAFIVVGVIGIVGNLLVIYAILSDKKMRSSATNLFIMNLAIADLMLMIFTVPEIVMFLINDGWMMGLVMCKLERFVLVLAAYSSVLTLVSVCVERYVAIVYPIKAHIFCSRKRILLVIGMIWPFTVACAIPVLLYNKIGKAAPGYRLGFCLIRFPGNHIQYLIPWKYLEAVLYYYLPMFFQIFFYAVIIKKLFASAGELQGAPDTNSCSRSPGANTHNANALKGRKSVVKMLIASVVIYFLSYSPFQVMLLYNTIAPKPFYQTWLLHVFVTMLTFVNSAANPVLYSIFSQNFRRKFVAILCRHAQNPRGSYRRTMNSTLMTDPGSTNRHYKIQTRNFAGNLKGICGNCNGNLDDDWSRCDNGILVPNTGGVNVQTATFGDSCRVVDPEFDGSDTCVTTPLQLPGSDEEMITAKASELACNQMQELDGLKECYETLPTTESQQILQSCTVDAWAVTSEAQVEYTVCAAMTELADACQARSIAVPDWKQQHGICSKYSIIF